MSERAGWIRLLVKYRGKCAQCGAEIKEGEYALWSRAEKSIRHEKCETSQTTTAHKEGPTDELNCFVCSKPAGCGDCGFESDCNRSMVSQACICSGCMADASAYSNYQQAFIAKMYKIARAKS